MLEQMTKQDAIEYLLYMKHDVQAKSPMDIALDTAIESLKQPTIKPEVRHGRWIYNGYDEYPTCSYCNQSDTYAGDYCGNCGARMDGGDDYDS